MTTVGVIGTGFVGRAPSNGKWRKAPPTIVMDNVSIGANSTILPSISLGSNCKIGMGSVVTKNVKQDKTAFGNPAR